MKSSYGQSGAKGKASNGQSGAASSHRRSGAASSYRRSGAGKKDEIKGKSGVDHENFCLAATCEDWSFYKQRQRKKPTDFEAMSKELQLMLKELIKIAKKKASPACFLWNPNSRERINLPKIDVKEIFNFRKCILTAPPTAASECRVLVLVEEAPVFLFYHLGDNKWSRYTYDGFLMRDAITFKGKLYAFNGFELWEIEIRPKQLEIMRRYVARLPVDCLHYEDHVYLVESCGELFAVRRKSIFHIDIDIFRMDFSQERWKRVLTIGENTGMFLVGHYSMSFSASSNTVYFTEKEDDETLYSFSLADQCLSLCKNQLSGYSNISVLRDELMPILSLPDEPDEPRFDQIINVESHETRERIEYNTTYDDQSGSLWFQLSPDVQKLISQHLSSPFDCINFRATCKAWRSLVHPVRWIPNYIEVPPFDCMKFRATSKACIPNRIVRWIPKTPNHIEVPFRYAWLMFPQREKGMYNLYDPIANLMHTINIPELEDCEVRFSNQGWLLVTKAPTSIFFFEPFTRRKIQLPHFVEEEFYQLDGLCFTNSPTSPGWQIFGISHFQLHQLRMKLLYLTSSYEEEGWRSQVIDSEKVIDPELFPTRAIANPVFDGQHWCYLGKNGSLISFEWTHNDVDWIIQEASLSLSSYSRCYLVRHDEDLLLICLEQIGKLVHIFKRDRNPHEWVPITILEKEILYLSKTTSLIVEDMEQRRSNTIQFSMFNDVLGNNIHYSLKTQTYNVHDVQVYSPVVDPYDVKEFLSATWIQPLLMHEMPPTA